MSQKLTVLCPGQKGELSCFKITAPERLSFVSVRANLAHASALVW
jgi:hypothetical protein